MIARESVRRLGLLLGSALLTLLVAEGAVRAAGLELRWLASLIFVMSTDVPVHRIADDPALVFTLRESAQATFSQAEPWGDQPRTVSVGAHGFRSPDRPMGRRPGTVRILCFGGSNTYGAAVSDENTWPAQLEVALNERLTAPVEVWNLGVSAWMTPQTTRLADRVIPELTPDLLLFQLFNVGPRNVLSEDLGDATAARAAFVRDPTLWGEQLRFVPTAFPARALFGGSALLRSVVLAANRIDRWGLPRGEQIEPLLEAARRRDAADFAAFVARHPHQALALVVVPAGGRPDWWDERIHRPVLDLEALPRPPVPGIEDIHPGAPGYRWYAEELTKLLTQEGGLLAGR